MGIAAGDYDANGTLDFFLTHAYNDTNSLHANRGGLVFEDVTRSNTSLVLQLVGVASHRNGWGGRAQLLDSSPVVVRELVRGASFQSASTPEIHLGLGHSQDVAIRISWPSGQVRTLTGLTPRTWVVIEGSRA